MTLMVAMTVSMKCLKPLHLQAFQKDFKKFQQEQKKLFTKEFKEYHL